MEPQSLKSALESILFVSNKPLSIKDFAAILEQQAFSIQAALDQLAEERKNSGIVLLENNGRYQLATNRENSALIKNFLNTDLREKLTEATVEVLAIIAYRQPISKAEIEAIRGVNSQYSIRQLLMRGLIEKIQNPHDARGFLYETTTEFLQHLGLQSVKELPEFQKLVMNIKLPEAVAEHAAEASPDTKNELNPPEEEPSLPPQSETEPEGAAPAV